MTTLEYKLHFDHIIERIEFARLKVNNHHIVKIVAASKYVGPEAIEALYQIGQRAFGENRVQDLVMKAEALEELPLEWHFIGSLQKNKINQLLHIRPALIHSIDSIDLAEALQSRLERDNMNLRALVQVNAAAEESKSGFESEAFLDAYQQIQETCPNLHLQGIMTIGAHSDDYQTIKKSFETTRKLFDQLQGATICSMGMSSDFELAIECGSTMVRLGSILFPEQ